MKLPEELLQKVGASHEEQAHADRYTPTVAQRPVLSCTARSKGMSDIAHNKESVRYRSVTGLLPVCYRSVTGGLGGQGAPLPDEQNHAVGGGARGGQHSTGSGGLRLCVPREL